MEELEENKYIVIYEFATHSGTKKPSLVSSKPFRFSNSTSSPTSHV